MLLVTKAYDVVTPESVKDGDIADCGFVYEDRSMTFRELVEELQDCDDLSSSHPEGDCIGVWASYTASQDADGSYRVYDIIFSKRNPPRIAKYWRKALKAAGFLKRKPSDIFENPSSIFKNI